MQIRVLNQKQCSRMIKTSSNDYTNILNAAEAMETCKNMKKMIKAQVL